MKFRIGDEISFVIGADDIQCGLPKDITKRPISRALRRVFSQYGTVRTTSAYILIADVCIVRNGSQEYYELQLSRAAARFTEKHDEGQWLQPGEFTATVVWAELEGRD